MRVIVGTIVEGRRIRLGRIGHELHEHLKQRLDPDTSFRRAEADRDQVPFAQGLLEGRVQLGRAQELTLFEIQRHQRVIDFHDLIDDLRMRCGDGRKIGRATAGGEIAILDSRTLRGGEVQRQTLGPERLLYLPQAVRWSSARDVDAVDDDQAIEAARSGPVHEQSRGHVRYGGGVHHDGDGFHRWQHGQRPADKIRGSRGVDQVQMYATMIDIDERRFERML